MSGGDTAVPDPRQRPLPQSSAELLRPAEQESRFSMVRVEAIMKEAQALQAAAKALTAEETALQADLHFAKEEESRLKEMLNRVEQELESSRNAVASAIREKDQHQCHANEADMSELQQVAESNARWKLHIREREETLNAVLRQAHEEMEAVSALQQQPLDTRSGLFELRKWVEASDIEVRSLEMAQDEERSLLEELSQNEKAINELRCELETAGLTIPNAPTVHRSMRLIRQRKLSSKGPVGEGLRQTRSIELPVGILGAVTGKVGTLQALGKECGIVTCSVDLKDSVTVVHCTGDPRPLDAFEAAIRTAAAAVNGTGCGPLTYPAGHTDDISRATANAMAALLNPAPH